MAVLQSTYAEDHSTGAAGLIANTQTSDVDSRRVKGSATTKIPFGRAVQQTSSEDSDQVIAGLTATANFAGITVIDSTLQPVQDDMYVVGDVASVLWRGDIWVQVEAAVTVGDDVTCDSTTGQLSTEAAASGQIAIVNARWMTAAAAAGLAIVRIGTGQRA